MFWFIDDLTVLNKGVQFRRRSKGFLPPWLKLKQTRDINAGDYFLDLGFRIGDDSFLLRFCDKRDDFLFFIFRIPYLCIIVPFKIFYSALGSEILEVARTTCICSEFKTSSRVLLCRAWNQGDNIAVSTATFSKYFGCYCGASQKFNVISITLSKSLFD